MKIIEQYNKTVRFVAIAVLDLFLTAIYGVVWYYRYNLNFEDRYIGKGIVFTLVAYYLITGFISIVLNVHKIDQRRAGEAIFSGVLTILFTNCVAFVQISLIDAKLVNVTPLIALTLAQSFIISIWAFIASWLVKSLAAPERMVIVYGSRLATDLVLKMSEIEDKFCICASVNTSDGYDEVIKRISDYSSVIVCDVPAQERNDLLKYCYENSKKIYIVPKISDVLIRGSAAITYFDCPLVCCTSSGLTVEQRLGKRITDILVSSLALIILSPLLAVISVAIKLCDGGPVLYKQERVTIDGKHFGMYKFIFMILVV